MRKYAFADENGRTPDNIQLKPGKYIANSGSKNDLILRTKHSCGESPELAALVSEVDQTKQPMKLYSIEQWAVDPSKQDGKIYMVVKEIEAPVVRLKQKLQFAIAALNNICDSRAFKKWADGWLVNSDRSKEAAVKVSKAAKEELEGIQSLVELGISTGDSHEEMQQQKEMLNRIVALTQAAALAADAGESDDNVCKLLAKAMENIQDLGKDTNLVGLAERICSKT